MNEDFSLIREHLIPPQSRSLPRSGTWSAPQAHSGLRRRRTGVCREAASSLRIAQVVCATALLLFLSCGALADQTNTWEFTNAANYTISDSALLEVDETAPGYAQLILQAQNIYHASISNYLNSSSNSLVGLGTDVSLRLSGSPGSYSPAGIFTSRTFDGGPGNSWQMIHSAAGNRVMENSGAEVLTSENGLVGLWHMNNSWQDSSINANDMTPFAGAGFSTTAKFGSHSGYFGPLSYTEVAGSLGLTNQLTISFWLKIPDPDAQIFNSPVSLGVGSSAICWIRVGGFRDVLDNPFGSIGVFDIFTGLFRNVTVSNTFTTATDGDVWRHIVVTYDNTVTPSVRIYKDTVLLPMLIEEMTTALNLQDKINFGIRSDYFSNLPDGLLDEVAIFNRAIA